MNRKNEIEKINKTLNVWMYDIGGRKTVDLPVRKWSDPARIMLGCFGGVLCASLGLSRGTPEDRWTHYPCCQDLAPWCCLFDYKRALRRIIYVGAVGGGAQHSVARWNVRLQHLNLTHAQTRRYHPLCDVHCISYFCFCLPSHNLFDISSTNNIFFFFFKKKT